MRRRHGWQRPLHPLQIVGMSIYSVLVVAFYTLLGLFVGNRVAVIVVTSIFSFTALAVMFLFVRCTAIDPTDKTNSRRKKKKKENSSKQLNYGSIFGHIIMRFFTRIERKILKRFTRQKYLHPLSTTAQMEPLLPFPLVIKDDSVSPGPLQDDISFCVLCDSQVKKHSKHCRTCNRCVEGFDHHCRASIFVCVVFLHYKIMCILTNLDSDFWFQWLNNCVGKKNYRSFILLLTFVLLMLMIEGGTAVAVFVRCFTDAKGLNRDLVEKLHFHFPRGLLAAICVLLVLVTAYGSAALGQLFFFHVVLIRKGMRTYDYIMAMKEENELLEQELSEEDSDYSSDESIELDSPEKTRFRICRERIPETQQVLSVRIDKEPESIKKPGGFRASISPWKLIKMSREKAQLAADKARERFMRQKTINEDGDSLKPLPLETKNGPSLKTSNIDNNKGIGVTPLVVKGMLSSPRRRFSVSPSSSKQKYKNNFDLKLTEVSRELDTYISRQVLCSVIKKDEPSPR
ncbi:hypothetical protein M8C21_013035 [Ambrosia artemisiifolia]|uniref:S-acyltransferase n=1 Tax=Ambrosia artemisiifolia TaxID=4212 RepID=A0AAD5GSS9_AMBAR|nr:hypothetical protein M8C21_013035 [Ambrosia artemisiifolia]